MIGSFNQAPEIVLLNTPWQSLLLHLQLLSHCIWSVSFSLISFPDFFFPHFFFPIDKFTVKQRNSIVHILKMKPMLSHLHSSLTCTCLFEEYYNREILFFVPCGKQAILWMTALLNVLACINTTRSVAIQIALKHLDTCDAQDQTGV